MTHKQNVLNALGKIPNGTTIIACKDDHIAFFKPDVKEGKFLCFSQTMWVKTWFCEETITLKHFDMIIAI